MPAMVNLFIMRLLMGVFLFAMAPHAVMAAVPLVSRPLAPSGLSTLAPSDASSPVPLNSTSGIAAATTAPSSWQQLLARDPQLVYDQSMVESNLNNRPAFHYRTIALSRQDSEAKPTGLSFEDFREFCWHCRRRRLSSYHACISACKRKARQMSRSSKYHSGPGPHRTTRARGTEVVEAKPTAPPSKGPCSHCYHSTPADKFCLLACERAEQYRSRANKHTLGRIRHMTIGLAKAVAAAKPTVPPVKKLCPHCYAHVPADRACIRACETAEQQRSRASESMLEKRSVFQPTTSPTAVAKEDAETTTTMSTPPSPPTPRPTSNPCGHCHRGQGGWLSSICQQSCEANLKNREETLIESSLSLSRKTATTTAPWKPRHSDGTEDSRMDLVAHYCFKYRWADDQHIRNCGYFMEPIHGCAKQEGMYPPECHVIIKAEVLKWSYTDIMGLFKYEWEIRTPAGLTESHSGSVTEGYFRSLAKRAQPTPFDMFADPYDEFEWHTTTSSTPTGAWMTWRPTSNTLLGPRTTKTLEVRSAGEGGYFFDRVFPHAGPATPTPSPTLLRHKHHHEEYPHIFPSATASRKDPPSVLGFVLKDSKDKDEEAAERASKGFMWFSVGLVSVLVFSILFCIIACIVQRGFVGCRALLSRRRKQNDSSSHRNNGSGNRDGEDDDDPGHCMHRLAPLHSVTAPSTHGSATPPPPYSQQQQQHQGQQQPQPGIQPPKSLHQHGSLDQVDVDYLTTKTPVDPWSPLSNTAPCPYGYSPYGYNPYTYPPPSPPSSSATAATVIAPPSTPFLDRALSLRGNSISSDSATARTTTSGPPLRTTTFPSPAVGSLRRKRASALFEPHVDGKRPDEFEDVDLKGPERRQEVAQKAWPMVGKEGRRARVLSSLAMRKRGDAVEF